MGLGVLLLFFTAVISISVGRYYIELPDVVRILANIFIPMEQTWPAQAESVIMTLRLPRVIAAIMIGAALSLSGASYQSVFKNPLVAPDMLGVASGACVGAAIGILSGVSQIGVQLGAFFGGLIAVSCTVAIPKIIGKDSIVMLVLSGIIVGGLMGSILGIIKYVADADTELPAITYWQLGSLVSVVWDNILYSGIPILCCIIFIMMIRWRINILTLSEEEAHTLGKDTRWLRYAIIFCATVLTACSVCISGTIGWVGLIIPHFSRMIVGPNNQRLLPLSAVLGGLFLLVIDTLSRVSTSSEIPLSVLTGLTGAPFYFYLLVRQRLSLS
ncbi:MAG: iron ABC transporter permease [Dialister sp.]|nr:iron ABC transporter permease [Dialister sp.]